VFKSKDNGSFSLVTLGIQAPGGTLSVNSMLIGNKEDWSSVATNALAAFQQWFLLTLCLFDKAKRHFAGVGAPDCIRSIPPSKGPQDSFIGDELRMIADNGQLHPISMLLKMKLSGNMIIPMSGTERFVSDGGIFLG
jgi:hypothetical protein